MKLAYPFIPSFFQSSPVATSATPPPSYPVPPSLSPALVTPGRAAARKARDRLHTLITQLRPPEHPVPMEMESQGAVADGNDVPMETVADGDASSSAEMARKSPTSPVVRGVKMWRPRKGADWTESAVTPEEMKEIRKKFFVSGGPMTCPIQV